MMFCEVVLLKTHCPLKRLDRMQSEVLFKDNQPDFPN